MARKGLFLFFLCLVACSPIHELKAFWGSEKLSPKAERAKKVLEGFDEQVMQSLTDYQIPGCAIGIVVDGYVVYSKGFGFRDREKKLSVTPDTLFLIGSLTKAFASFSMGCLVDEGLANWDDRIVDWLPDFRLSDQYVSQELTIRDLLSHQTRLPRHDAMWYNSNMAREELFHRLRYLDLASDDCDHFHYNSLMYFVVGMAMEKITKKSWQEIVTQRILTPLRMTHTGFSGTEMIKSSDYALPYIENEGSLKRMTMKDLSLIEAGGGMYSSASDLCRWIQLHLNQGEWQQKPLISLGSFKEMQAPQVVATGYPESKEVQVRAYGLGWYVQSYLGFLNLLHDGTIDGYSDFISLLPQKDIGIVILCNKNLTAWSRLMVMEAFDRILELPRNDWLKEGLNGLAKNKEMGQENQHREMNRKLGTSPSHPLQDYVGDYDNPGYGRVSIECVDGALRAVFHNISFSLEHWHYDVFNICGQSEDTLISLKNVKTTFRNNLNGDISEVSIPLEVKAPDIVFTRKQSDSLTNSAYLRTFAGNYEIYSYTVEILMRNQTLYAVIPGQPMYELIPLATNEFAVKSFTGFTVRFVIDENKQVQEALLIQPYGIVYTAKRKRS